MEANFNNLRMDIAESYNNLIEKLNNNASDGTISLEVTDIEKECRDLRDSIATLVCLYIPGDPGAVSLANKYKLSILRENLNEKH